MVSYYLPIHFMALNATLEKIADKICLNKLSSWYL